MAFSGGGSAPLVTTRYDGQELSLSWPSTLPAPIIQGDSLLYPSVLPDVDLKITVTTTSFSELLIVRTPQAADLPQLRRVTLGIDALGVLTTDVRCGVQAGSSLDLFRRAGSPAGEAMAACHLAHTLELLGEYSDGVLHAHRALELAEEGQHKHLAASASLALSMLYGHLGEHEQERRYSEHCLATFAEIDYRPGRARALYNLGLAQSRRGRSASALRLLVDAAEACDAAGLVETGIRARADAAELRLRQGRPELAARLCFDALELATRSGCEVGEAALVRCSGGRSTHLATSGGPARSGSQR